MGCDEMLSGLQEILLWVKQSMTGLVFEEEPEGLEHTMDSNDDWYHFEASPSCVEHWD
jgi:hypothetical protein